MPAVGYAMVSGYTGVLAANMSFYADTNRDKISSIMGSGYYSQYNQFWVIINSNILTARQKLNLVGDL